MTSKKSKQKSVSEKFEPTKVSFAVASVAALSLLVFAVLLLTSA